MRRSLVRVKNQARRAAALTVEALEHRTLLSATIAHAVAPVVLDQDTPESIDLSSNFTDPTFAGTLVQIQTTLGNIDVELNDNVAPLTVANFLNYASSGLYDNTIIHRVVDDPSPGIKIIQGGGFQASGAPIATPFGNLQNEFSLSNLRGTIAMAKLPGDPNSATSQWFINDQDNTGLDTSDGGFTVFGAVISGMNIVDEITALTTVDGTALNPQFDNSLPVINPTTASSPPVPTDLVGVMSVTILPQIALTATSEDPTLVTTDVTGSQLTLSPIAGKSGITFVRVTATDLVGHQVSDVFKVEVAPAAPRALDVTLGAGHARILTYTETDRSHGQINFEGPGTLIVHFAGDAPRLVDGGSRVTGQNLQVLGMDATGTTAQSSLTTRGHVGKDSIINVGSIVTDGAFGAMKLVRSFVQGEVTVPGGVGSFYCDFARGGTIDLGTPIAPGRSTNLTVSTIIDENLTTTARISQIRAFNWFNADDLSESVQAPVLSKLISFGNFTPGLQLSGAIGFAALGRTQILGTIGGTWSVAGGVPSLRVGSVAPDFDGTFPTPINSLSVKGNFAGRITAPSIGTMSVRGAMSGAAIILTAPGLELGSLSVRKGISDTLIDAAGNIGTISTSKLLNSIVYAGVAFPTGGGGLPATVADFDSSSFTAPGAISSIRLGSGASFINSNIAAPSLGTLRLGATATLNNGTPFGIATSSLVQLNVRDKSQKQPPLVFKSIHSAADVTAQSVGLTLNDFTINIV